MTFTKRDRRALIVGAALLAVIVLVKFAALPWLDGWRAVRARMSDAQAQLTQLETRARRLLNQRQQLTPLYGRSIARPLVNPDRAGLALVKAAENALKTSGIQIQNVRAQPAQRLRDVPGVAMVSIQVQCQGNLNALAKCLVAFRAAEPLILVDRINADNDPRRPGTLKFTFVLVTLAKQEQRA